MNSVMILPIVVTALIVSLSAAYNSPQNTVYDFTVKDIDGEHQVFRQMSSSKAIISLSRKLGNFH